MPGYLRAKHPLRCCVKSLASDFVAKLCSNFSLQTFQVLKTWKVCEQEPKHTPLNIFKNGGNWLA
jgi:hypothetical protein